MFILSPGCLAPPDNSLLTVKRTTLSFIACSFMLPSSPLDVNFLSPENNQKNAPSSAESAFGFYLV